MGGHAQGEVASAVAIYSICQSVKKGMDLAVAIELAHQELVQKNKRQNGQAADSADKKSVMGTTVVALQCKGPHYKIAWVGDSRAYLIDDRKITQLSKDHSLKQQLLDMKALAPENAEEYVHGATITQALGVESAASLRVDEVSGELAAGQFICLCSDGLSDLVDESQIQKIFSKQIPRKNLNKLDKLVEGLQNAADQLVQAALKAGGKDNVTVQLVGLTSNNGASTGTAKSWFKRLINAS